MYTTTDTCYWIKDISANTCIRYLGVGGGLPGLDRMYQTVSGQCLRLISPLLEDKILTKTLCKVIRNESPAPGKQNYLNNCILNLAKRYVVT